MRDYVTTSLELHLFFGRIMKEHALFLLAGFTPANPAHAEKAKFFLKEFESLLKQALTCSDGIVSKKVLSSGEIVTEFTTLAERQTERFTGIPIDKDLTAKALRLTCGACSPARARELHRQVRQLNRTALKLMDGLIGFKEAILDDVLQGRMFTINYPLLIEHIIREARLYRKFVEQLEREGALPRQSMCEMERFWNRIMMEHAMFIRGLLDPCETELFGTADDFAKCFCELLDASRCAHDKTLETTAKFRDFKTAGAKGIQQCKIRSVILPLLADHVLREANHFLRLLQP